MEREREGGREGGRRRPFDLLLMGFIVKPEPEPWSGASGPTSAAAAPEPPSSVTQATKTPTSTVSMKLNHRPVPCESISKSPAFRSTGGGGEISAANYHRSLSSKFAEPGPEYQTFFR